MKERLNIVNVGMEWAPSQLKRTQHGVTGSGLWERDRYHTCWATDEGPCADVWHQKKHRVIRLVSRVSDVVPSTALTRGLEMEAYTMASSPLMVRRNQ